MPDSPVPAKYDEDAAFERVMQACRAAEAKGWKIGRNCYVRRAGLDADFDRCCPIGAFVVEAGVFDSPAVTLTDGLIDAAIRRWRHETRIGDRAYARQFYTEIDSGRGDARTRAGRLARRVRAALWPETA